MLPEPLPSSAAADIRARIDTAATAACRGAVRLLAVSKLQPAKAVAALAAAGQDAFGENYVQEAMTKREALEVLGLEWHLVGPLQSNKCREAAATFDWVQSVDRLKLIESLARHRIADAAPLNLLIQVNIDDEAAKSGCRPEEIEALAQAIIRLPNLRLRGLMAIPAPHPELTLRRASFRAMRTLFEALQAKYAGVDTLSMGMSDDFELAIAEGATMVRIGTALFGPRS